MKKRVFSLFLALVVTFSMVCPLVFADDSSTHVHNWTSGVISEFSDTVEGIPVSVSVKKCTECNFYKHTYKFFGLSFDFYSVTAYTGIVDDFLLDVSLHIMNALGKNATAKPYQTGGGSAGTGGVGRRPSGYSQNNTPNVTQAGQMHFYAPVTGWTRAIYSTSNCSFWSSNRITDLEVPSANASGTVFPSNYSSDSYVIAVCAFTAPVSGTYSVLPGTTIAKYRYIRSNTWYTAVYTSKSATGSYAKGDSAWLVALAGVMPSTYPYDAEGYGVDIYVAPLESTIKPSNSITINQNVWNGNIYQDNSTNLTYIYPQYTTINENNETVTNISNNPIIYNNETEQYYTYDSVTNNYYYITYETPTPSPSPDPGTDPTPTPEPGEDTGDTSGIMKILQEIKAVLVSGFAGITEKLQNIGVGGSTPETAKPGSSSGGQSWWEKLLGKIGDAIMDGLLGAISAVLKLIFKLFTTILGWIIWLVSQVLTLFPFLPPGLGALLIGGVVVCFIIGLIKFIRG